MQASEQAACVCASHGTGTQGGMPSQHLDPALQEGLLSAMDADTGAITVSAADRTGCCVLASVTGCTGCNGCNKDIQNQHIALSQASQQGSQLSRQHSSLKPALTACARPRLCSW